jgi:site-specific DNA recombinase
MKDGKIIVLEHEAEQVRLIYRRYLELSGVNALVRDLKERNIRTKTRLLATGGTRGDSRSSSGDVSGSILSQ